MSGFACLRARTPFVLWLEVDHGFEHLRWRWVRRCRGSPTLVENRFHFGERLDDAVLHLEKIGGLGHQDARQRRWRLVPALMVIFVRGRIVSEQKNPLNRLLIWLYRPLTKIVLGVIKAVLRRPSRMSSCKQVG